MIYFIFYEINVFYEIIAEIYIYIRHIFYD